MSILIIIVLVTVLLAPMLLFGVEQFIRFYVFCGKSILNKIKEIIRKIKEKIKK